MTKEKNAMTAPKTSHSFLSTSGIVNRILLLLIRVTPEPTDIIVAGAFGVVELLGAKRLWKILLPALKQQLRTVIHATTDKKTGTSTVPKHNQRTTVD